MIIDRYNDYYEDERLYSTGDYELDELLERAFCDGYSYAQREFGSLQKLGTLIARNGIAKNIKESRKVVRSAERLANSKRYRNDETVYPAITSVSNAIKDKIPELIKKAQQKLPKSGTENYKKFVDKNKIRLGHLKDVIDNYKNAGTRYGVGM